MNKETNSKWMNVAEEILQDRTWICPLFKDPERTTIFDSYNGQISALSVSVLMIGLKPTIAVYYQDEPKPNKHKAYRRCLLEVLVRMLNQRDKNDNFGDLKKFVRYVMDSPVETLTTDIINCSVALKQVIRTYNLD